MTSDATDTHGLGRTFARELLANPTVPTDGLTDHPLSRAHAVSSRIVYFLAGRESQRIGLDDDQTGDFVEGLIAGMSDRETPN